MDNLKDHVMDIFNTRGNSGKKAEFYEDMSNLAIEHTSLANALIPLVPIYGYWKDLWVLWHSTPELRNSIDTLVQIQFSQDQESENPSMLAKWLPREGSACDQKILARHFANLLFPLTSESSRMKTYRKACAALNRILDTTEVKMCAKQWEQINFEHVPGYLLKNYKRTFLRHQGQRYTDYMNTKPAHNFQERDCEEVDLVYDTWKGLKESNIL